MDTSDWINLIAAILIGGGTLFLGFMALRTIRQTRSIQMAEKKERLLNEIIEWAVDVAKYSIETGVFDETIPISGLAAERVLPELLNSVVNFRMARAKSVYILNITSEINPELKASEIALTEEIKKQIKFLMEYKRKLTPTWPADQVVAKIAGNNERIYNLATELIEEATKIKTGDIGKKEENMPKEGKATVSSEPTMKSIEDHLKRQDKKLEEGTYFSGYVFGATLIFIAFGLLAGKYILTTESWFVTYCIVILIGGTVVMGFAWFKRRTLGK